MHNTADANQRGYLELLKKCLTASIYDESAWRVIEGKPTFTPEGQQLVTSLKNWARERVIRELHKRSLLLVRRRPFDPAAAEAGGDWPCFGFTMIGHRGLRVIEKCVDNVLADNVPGDFIETGAWRGGATIFMRALLRAYGVTNRLVWVADSFEGLPRPKDAADGWDLSHVQHLKVSLEQVKANFARFDLLDNQVRFLPGWFKDTLSSAPIGPLAILRLDGDLYSSTMDVLSNLYAKVSRGGYVIVDDYFTWPSCKSAVDDFLSKNGIQANIQGKDIESAYWKVGD